MSLSSIIEDLNPWWADPLARRANVPAVRRDLQREVLGQLADLGSRRAVVVYGPRQVGKTVLLHQVADDLIEEGWPAAFITYFDFSDDRLTGPPISPRDVVEARSAPSGEAHRRVFLFDEVEHSRGWDRFLKQAVERSSDRFLLTSSAASHLRRSGRESGPGRWDEHRLEGLCFREYLRILGGGSGEPEAIFEMMPQALASYIAGGGFPEHMGRPVGEIRRRLRHDIAERAILRDLLRTGVDVQRVKDLFVYLVQDSGAIFDARSRAGDLEADRRSVREWVRLLEETCLIASLPCLSGSARSRMRSRPRLYAADHGIVGAFLPGPAPHRDPEVRGQLIEAVVFRHLRGLGHAEIHYFRTKRGEVEADFVVDLPGGRTAVEVTAGRSPRRKKIARLREAGEALGTSRLVLIHGGEHPGAAGPVRLLPLHRFLLDPASSLEEGEP